jgi:hypothetical protein
MRSLRTVLLAFAGLALPVGLALAVYLSSAGTIAATPASLDISAERIAQPSSPRKASALKRDEAKKDKGTAGTTTAETSHSGTTTDDDGDGTSTEDNSGPGGGDDSGPSDSSGSGSSGSGSGSNSGPGGGGDDD